MTKSKRERNCRECSNIIALVSVHWLARLHAKLPRGSSKIQHPAGIEPISPNSLRLALTTEPSESLYQPPKENNKWLVVSCNLEPIFFAYRIVVSGLIKLNIKARHEIPEFFYRKPFTNTCYSIGDRLEFHYFHFAQFCSMLMEQLIDHRKVWIENLKLGQIFKIKDGRPIILEIMDGRPIVQEIILYKGRLLKNLENGK